MRYCFDIPKNETVPEYGDPDNGGNGTFFNLIQMKLKANITNSIELENIQSKSSFGFRYLEYGYD